MTKKEVKIDSFRSPIGDALLVPGQVVIVTTVDTDGVVNAAVKSDFMRMVSKPPILAFGCNLNHHTAQNILERHEFVINIPGEDIIKQTMETAKEYPKQVNELEKAGLHAEPSLLVSPPRIAECPVNLECSEEWIKTYGDEIIIFGRVVAASIDEDILRASVEERYKVVRPIFSLGERQYAVLGAAKRLP